MNLNSPLSLNSTALGEIFCSQMMTLCYALLCQPWKLISSAVEWFSCVEVTSTLTWQYSPTKWLFGSQNTLWIYKQVCTPVITHTHTHTHTHTQLPQISRHTHALSEKGYNAVWNKGADGWQWHSASTGEVVRRCISVGVCAGINTYMCHWSHF